MATVNRQLANALALMTRDARIRAFLLLHDRKALEQCREALISAGVNPDPDDPRPPSVFTYFVGLTWSEAANVALAAAKVDTSAWTPASRGALNRAIAKIGQTIPHNTADDLDRIFLTALQQEGGE